MTDYVLEDVRCTTREELADAMAVHWDQAHTHLARGYIGRWLEEDLRDYSAKIELEKLSDRYEYVGVVAALFVQKYGTAKTARLCGIELTLDSLLSYFTTNRDDEGNPTGDARRVAGLIYECGLLRNAKVFPDQERASALDAAWRREFESYLLTLGEMMSYRDVWGEPVLAIKNAILSDPQDNMELTEAALRGGAVPQALHTDYYLPGHVDTLVALMESDDLEELNAGRPLEDLPQHEIAMQEAWFADMANVDSQSLGRRVQMRMLHSFALAKHGERVLMKNVAQVREDEGVDSSQASGLLSRLSRKAQAGLFAALVFLPSVMLMSTEEAELTAFALFAALVVTVGLTPFRMRKFETGGKFGMGIAVLILSSWVLPYGQRWESMPLGVVLFLTGLAAAAGWFRDGLLLRRKEREAKALSASGARPGHLNTTEKMTAGQVRAELGTSVYADTGMRPQQGSHQAPAGCPSSQSPAGRPSRVAANHGSGNAVNILGTSYASDGTRTTEVVDGISIDSNGGHNVRVVDGLTLHSDGKRTVEITEGLRIRSDGQKSVDFLGQSLSWGGEDDKKSGSWFDPKEETDWFGNKKKKGWFD